MRSIITFVFVILFLQTYATEQSGDKLIFKSDTMYIYNYPLDSLIKTVPPLEKINKMDRCDKIEFDKKIILLNIN